MISLFLQNNFKENGGFHLLKLENISKLYKEPAVAALTHINLHIARGEYVAIIGASGSGKTTLMHILGCLDSPTSGAYFLNGINVSQLSDTALAQIRGQQIGFVFQAFCLSPDLSALDNVALPLAFRGVTRQVRLNKAKEALSAVGLSSRMQHFPNQLSGGQQQRVAIARAICGNPAVLLADEPTGNLDPRATQEILTLLDTLHTQGNTIVLITHDEAVAARAQRIIQITNGQQKE